MLFQMGEHLLFCLHTLHHTKEASSLPAHVCGSDWQGLRSLQLFVFQTVGHIMVETSCRLYMWGSWMTSLISCGHPCSKQKNCLYRRWDHEVEKKCFAALNMISLLEGRRQQKLFMLCALRARSVEKALSSTLGGSASSKFSVVQQLSGIISNGRE